MNSYGKVPPELLEGLLGDPEFPETVSNEGSARNELEGSLDMDDLLEPFVRYTATPPRTNTEEQIALDQLLEAVTGATSGEASAMPSLLMHKDPKPAGNSSRHSAYVRAMVDSMRHRLKVKNSESWDRLVKSCTSYVEASVAR
jgi:hypothetical protein